MHYLVRTLANTGCSNLTEWNASAVISEMTQIYNDYTGNKVEMLTGASSNNSTMRVTFTFNTAEDLTAFANYFRTSRDRRAAHGITLVDAIDFSEDALYNTWLSSY